MVSPGYGLLLTLEPDFNWDPRTHRDVPRSHGFGLPLHLQRQQMLIASEVSPGGGGPGLSLTSTTPPLSLEATGASLTQLGKPGGPARLSKRGSRPRRKRCPKGYRWSRRHRKCMRADRLFPFRYWTSQYGNGGKY